jgi:hypothetical protein
LSPLVKALFPSKECYGRRLGMADCIVPGCRRSGQNTLSVRVRKPDTTAVWAFETSAHVCDLHAHSGARIGLVWEPTTTGKIEFNVQGAGELIKRRSGAIRP